MTTITPEIIENSLDWSAYLALTRTLVEAKKTTGPLQSEEMAHYTMLNEKRLLRVYKHLEIEDAFIQILKNAPEQIWLVITEPWCGDAAQTLPIMALAAEQNTNITLRFVLRDENPELMNQFLTNGGKSIPILISIHPETMHVNWHWGPRPEKAQELFLALKSQNSLKEDISMKLQEWYNHDKGKSTLTELTNQIKNNLS